MTLRDAKIPHSTLKQLMGSMLLYERSILTKLFTSPPVVDVHLLDYFRAIRKDADNLYKLSLRMSQVAATAMECIEEGSSSSPVEEPVKVPKVPREVSNILQEKKPDEKVGGETESPG